MALLVKELDSSNEWAACRAAHALEILGENGRPCFNEIERAAGKPVKARNYAFELALGKAIPEAHRRTARNRPRNRTTAPN